MDKRKLWAVLLPAALLLIGILAATGYVSPVAENPNLARVTFVVS